MALNITDASDNDDDVLMNDMDGLFTPKHSNEKKRKLSIMSDVSMNTSNVKKRKTESMFSYFKTVKNAKHNHNISESKAKELDDHNDESQISQSVASQLIQSHLSQVDESTPSKSESIAPTSSKSKKKRIYKQKYKHHEMLRILAKDHNDCIRKDSDGKYYCLDSCKQHATNLNIQQLTSQGTDVFAQEGQSQLRPDRVMKHLHGDLHNHCLKIKAYKENAKDPNNEWNAMLLKLGDKRWENLIVELLTVYMDCKIKILSAKLKISIQMALN